MVGEIEKQVVQYESDNAIAQSVVSDDPLRMSPRNFIVETF